MKPAVFLDRDGTVNVDVGYLCHPDQITLLSRAVEGLHLLRDCSLALVIITNQAGVARGLIPPGQLPVIQRAFLRLMRAHAIPVAGYYACPHHPEGSVAEYRRACDCRKPAPGLVLQAARELDLDVQRSYVIGDKPSDVQLAHNTGATGILVLTGEGRKHLENYPPGFTPPHMVCDDLYEAAKWIAACEGKNTPR
ncbi:MAG: HAD family hydrolase [Deltaproteobacteria bacterium]|nr:HAD family hydrolase [Deltaproteobacteria bacterium]